MLGNVFQKPQDEKMRVELEKKRKLLLARAAKLKKLISNDSGWNEYGDIVAEYIDHLKKVKALTALDTVNPEALERLKLQDHEIFILTWALKIPQSIMKQAEDAMKPKEKDNGQNDQN